MRERLSRVIFCFLSSLHFFCPFPCSEPHRLEFLGNNLYPWRLHWLLLESLSTHVFETRTATGRGHFACQDNGVSQIFISSISNGEKILGNANSVVWRQVKRENSSLPVADRVSKTRVLKLPIYLQDCGPWRGKTFSWGRLRDDPKECLSQQWIPWFPREVEGTKKFNKSCTAEALKIVHIST